MTETTPEFQLLVNMGMFMPFLWNVCDFQKIANASSLLKKVQFRMADYIGNIK